MSTPTDRGPPMVRITPTEIDAADPFASTTQRVNPSIVEIRLSTAQSVPEPPTQPQPALFSSPPKRVRRPSPVRLRRPTPRRLVATTMAESDPATVLVRKGAHVDLPSGSIVDEIYEIDAKLGAGAMGEVYAARHVKLGKRVAIKVIGPRLSEDAAAIERFAMEARTLAQIQHPAIVAVEHVGELPDGRAYFVMEFLRGESLFEQIQRGRVPFSEALRVIDQMARGLEAAHNQGVIHRDLKPENTFLVHLPGEPSVVKLVDFGLAKIRVLDPRIARTQSGVALGTPMYMSPEQMRGPDVDHRTDIYALGCVAYELLLGVTPFSRALTTPALYAAHLHETPPLPRSIWPEIPPQIDLCLFAMLAKDPAYRPTLAQVRTVIAAASPHTIKPRAETELVRQRSGKRAAIAVITLVALLAMVSGITIGSVFTAKDSGSAHSVLSPTPVPVLTPLFVQPTSPSIPEAVHPPSVPIKLETPSVAAAKNHVKINNTSTSRAGIQQPQPEAGSAMANEGIDNLAATVPPSPPSPSVPEGVRRIDRNQTVNPFVKKHKEGP